MAKLDVDPGRRLVEDEQVRVGDERPSEDEAAFHAAGEPVEARVTLVLDADRFSASSARSRPRRADPVVARLVFEHLADGEKAVHVELLGREADAVACLAVVVFHVVAEHLGAPAVLVDETDQVLINVVLPLRLARATPKTYCRDSIPVSSR